MSEDNSSGFEPTLVDSASSVDEEWALELIKEADGGGHLGSDAESPTESLSVLQREPLHDTIPVLTETPSAIDYQLIEYANRNKISEMDAHQGRRRSKKIRKSKKLFLNVNKF